jgi:tetratricopeptide (TPR) repeat protein
LSAHDVIPAIDSNELQEYATAHRGYAAHLAALGRSDESVAAIQRALELDPLSPILGVEIARNRYMAHEFETARMQAMKVLELEPAFAPATFVCGLAHEQLGHHEEALQAFQRAAAHVPNPAILASEAYTRGVMGRREEASALLRHLEDQSRQHYVAPYWFALVHAGLNDPHTGLTWLERGLEQRDAWLLWARPTRDLIGFAPPSMRTAAATGGLGLDERALV